MSTNTTSLVVTTAIEDQSTSPLLPTTTITSTTTLLPTYLPVLSQLCGIAYLFCWSAMYYPQLYLNFKRKSVQGFSLDLWLYNLSGFLGYTIYNCYRAHIQNTYNLPKAVKTNDVVFAVHGLICNILIGLQVYFYDRAGQKISKWTWSFVGFACCIFLYLSFLASIHLIPWDALLDSSSNAIMTPIQFLGTIKVIITFVKYIPQIIMNHRRKSTAGLAIQVPMMDIGGALFSSLQNILDAIYNKDIHIVTGNLPKMLIGAASSLYGFFILFQHFVLYRPTMRYEPVSEVELGPMDDGKKAAEVRVYQEAPMQVSRRAANLPVIDPI
ncbi:hypothetical protein FOL47_011022 [Perkinsus chesapeaki]|uniref:Cystinosin n=1 Tax=Perkinsus chesapeaki TaxID=330153 RepID=A0A7J6MND6_PERCH|nr:hypothetical protein FOL47_011022 [Perkinsus chesapeaki]